MKPRNLKEYTHFGPETANVVVVSAESFGQVRVGERERHVVTKAPTCRRGTGQQEITTGVT